MTPTEGHGFDVCVWRDGNGFQKPTKIFQAVELQTFIRGSLSGRLKWAPATGLTVPAIGHVAKVFCRCKHHAPVLLDIELDIARPLPGHINPRVPVERFAEHPQFLRSEHARTALGNAGVSLGFGMWKRRHSRFAENYAPYVKTLCTECGLGIDPHIIKEFHSEPSPLIELTVTLSPQLLDSIPSLKRQLECWWFDTR